MDGQTKVYQNGLLFQTSEFWFQVESLCKTYRVKYDVTHLKGVDSSKVKGYNN